VLRASDKIRLTRLFYYAMLLRTLTALILAANCIAQTASAPKKPASKSLSSAAPSFACPDPEYEQACKSYEELLKARDEAVTPAAGNTRFVCFRKKTDEFLVIYFSTPIFSKKWDQQLQQLVVDPTATYQGLGTVHTFKDGVLEGSAAPSMIFVGKWIAGYDGGTFVSNVIDFHKQDETNPASSVVIDDSQITVNQTFKNKLDKNIKYTLTIQRSTGRFSENFLQESEQIPFLQNVGRCVKGDQK